MTSPVVSTRLYQLRELAIQQAFEMLKGRPLVDSDGELVLVNGEIYLLPPSPAALNTIRQLLKDNGVDRDPVETTVAKRPITALIPEDEALPTLLE